MRWNRLSYWALCAAVVVVFAFVGLDRQCQAAEDGKEEAGNAEADKADENESQEPETTPPGRADKPSDRGPNAAREDRETETGPVILFDAELEKLEPDRKPKEAIDVTKVKLTKLREIKESVKAYEDKEVVIKGEYMGWTPDPKRTIGVPLSRMDWAVKDENGDCIYVTAVGMRGLPLHPYRDIGRPIVVRARVRLKPRGKVDRIVPGPKPYLEPLVVQVGKKKPEPDTGNVDKE